MLEKKRASTADELLDSLTASLGDWLGVDGHHYTVAELREAIERSNHTPNRSCISEPILTERQQGALRRYQELDECLPHEEPCTGDPITCGCWQAMLLAFHDA